MLDISDADKANFSIQTADEIYSQILPDQAEKVYQEAIESNCTNAKPYSLLGEICFKSGDFEKARKLFEIAFALEPLNISHGQNLAYIYAKSGNIVEAVKIYKTLLGFFPNDEHVIEFLRNYYTEAPNIDEKLIKFRQEVDLYLESMHSANGPRVLFGLSFSIYEPCRIHDFFLAQALKLRGANILALSLVSQENGKITAVEEGENKIFGGVWGGFTGDPEHDSNLVQKHAHTIYCSDRLLWQSWAGIQPQALTDYIELCDRERILQQTRTYSIQDYPSWSYKSLPLGKWALDALMNNELVGDVKLVKNWEQKLYHYTYNILLLYHAYSRAVDEINPDIIISSDTYYYPYAILELLARERSLPSYNSWSGTRMLGWCYAKGEACMKLNLEIPWQTWKTRHLNNHENELVDRFLEKRRSGHGMVLDTASASPNSDPSDDPIQQMDFSKPTALLPANIIWDLSAMNKDLLFDSMVSWIHRVIDFFVENPQFQLIIKTHPGEKNKKIPVTRQLMSEEIRKYRPQLPGNIVLLEPDAPVSIYDIIPLINVGLVYTTTVGLEVSAIGKPIVTCANALYRGKGFTHDPQTVGEYFDTIKKLLLENETDNAIEQRRKLAKQFFYLYYFRYYASLNLFDYSYGGTSIPFTSQFEDILPGVNPVLDYIADSILGHRPIVSKTSVPPAGGYVRNQYRFTVDEISQCGKLFANGYCHSAREHILNSNDRFDHVRIEDFNFYVSKQTFKPGELAWIFNETFVDQKENPHAYETEDLKIAPGDTVVDLGACAGFFIANVLNKGARKVYAFEPHPRLMAGVEKSFQAQIRAGQVVLYPVALSNKNGEAFLDDSGDFICESKINIRGDNNVTVQTLDSWVLAEDITKIDFVKMDVEGEEMNVIQGAAGTITRFRPKLSIAVYHDYPNAQEVKDLLLKIRPDYHIEFGGCYMFETPFRPYMVYAY